MPRITSQWYRREVTEHNTALAQPQRFPLTGDGAYTRQLTKQAWSDQTATARNFHQRGHATGANMAAARYRDWAIAEAETELTTVILNSGTEGTA